MDLEQIRASNGNGEAVRASVTAIRAIGSTTLNVDSLTNWPTKFIATSGQLLPDGTLDQATVTVFKGEVLDSSILITSFEPGYEDRGHSVGEIIVIKPSTAWADGIADFLSVSHTSEGAIAQSDSSELGLKFLVSATQPAPEEGNIIIWFEPLEA